MSSTTCCSSCAIIATASRPPTGRGGARPAPSGRRRVGHPGERRRHAGPHARRHVEVDQHVAGVDAGDQRPQRRRLGEAAASQAAIRALCGRSFDGGRWRQRPARDGSIATRRDGAREQLPAEHSVPLRLSTIDVRASHERERRRDVRIGRTAGRRSCAGGATDAGTGRGTGGRRATMPPRRTAMRITLVHPVRSGAGRAGRRPVRRRQAGSKPAPPAARAGARAVPHPAHARRDARQAGRGHHRARRDRHRPAARAGAQPRRAVHQDGAGRRLHRHDLPPRRAPGHRAGRRSADQGSGHPRQGRHRRPQPAGAGRPRPRSTRAAPCRR